jgi:hypothetical protein
MYSFFCTRLDHFGEVKMIRSSIFVLFVVGFLLAGTSVSGYQAATAGGVTLEDVIALLDAKMPEAVVISKVKSNGSAFDLSTQDLIRLKKAGASEAVLLHMMTSGAAAPSAVPVAAKAASTAETTAGTMQPFSEVGVYYKKQGVWTELLPEIINWKTGGVLKTIGSAGIVKKDVNGHIPGPNSRNSVNSPLEFMVYAPEGVAITEYQLIRLRAHPGKDYREFRTITGGVFNQKSGAMRDMVPFEGKKAGTRLYSVVLPNTLGAGEYGFVYMGATGGAGSTQSMSMGKMYTFRLLE